MAKRVQILLEDDLDGSVAAETVTFGLDGVTYEIDLSAANAARLRDSMSEWVGHATRVGGRRSTTPASSGSGRKKDGRDLAAIREWARARGEKVSDRGRVSAAILEAYDKAHR